MTMMKIGLLQFDIAWEDPEKNRERIRRIFEGFRDADTMDWLLLPEMSLSGFSMDPKKTEVSEQDFEFFGTLAGDHGMYITFGGVHAGRNCSITVTGEEVVARYAKVHLFSPGGESRAYTPGKDVLTFRLGEVNVTPFVCYDLRFPDAFYAAAEQTDIFAVIANWPARRQEHWKTLLRARAVENQAFVAAVNRIGCSPDAAYRGGSTVIAPDGKIVADFEGREGILVAEIDPGDVKTVRNAFPVFNDRKPGKEIQ